MLLEAKLQNLEVKRVEIGNELYLSTESYQEKFATPQDYANFTMQWEAELKNYLGNDLQVCAVGSNKDYKGGTNSRRSTWNSSLINTISASLPDAFSIHHYREAGIANFTNTTNDYNAIFQNAINNFNDLNNSINQLSTNNTTPIWITEYNLFDNSIPIHGTWCHGLYTALSTLKFLENNRITACNLHAQSGNYVFGNFFNTNSGLDKSGNFQTIFPDTNNTTTAVYGKTSEGIAMEQIGIALKNALSGSKINFNSAVPNTIPTLSTDQALYGWTFNESGNNNGSSIILNLSNATLSNVDVSNLGITSQSELIQISCNNPALYANGFSTFSGNSNTYDFINRMGQSQLVSVSPQNIPANNLITLPPYSISRIKKNLNWKPRLYALNDTIKAGSTVIVTLLNKDTIPYNWGNGNDTATYIEFTPTSDTTITLNYSLPDSTSNYIVSKFIKVIQSPVAVTINASTTSYCPGSGSVTLSAIASGGNSSNYRYIWITTPTDDMYPDYNKGVGNTGSVLVNPEFPTTYTVYVTDGVTVAKKSIFINVPTAFVLAPSYTACFNSDITVDISSNANNNTTYSYLWNGNTNTISTTNNNPVTFTILRPNVSTSGNLIVSVSTTGCTTTKTAVMNFYECCSTSLIQINPGSDVNDLETLLKNNSSYNLTKANGGLKIQCNGNSFIINGDFHVKDLYDPASTFITDLELESCNVDFTEGASITVEPGFSLTLNNSNLDAACSQMWKGIIVNAGTLTTDSSNLNGTSIKNAEVAINSYPGSSLNIRRTIFENNIIGIEADHQSADGDNLQFFNIWANEFKGVGTLKTHYVGQPFPIGALPYSGMLLNRVNSSIGVPNSMGSSNKFSNLNAGIICENSNLNFQNCDFLNIEIDNAYLYPAGTSIFAVGNCKINGDDLKMEKWQSKTFPSYGIFLLQGNDLNIQNSKFTNLERAIQNDWSNFKNYNITENTFIDCKTGIEWWESTSENVAEIYRNTFDATLDLNNHLIRPDLEAIHVFGGSRDFPFSIFENNINNHLVGVYAVQLNGKKYGQFIRNNHISLNLGQDYVNSFFDFRGISLQYCDFIKVLQNDITWNLTSRDDIGFRVEGIRFENCKYSLISDNLLTNLQRGIYGAGTCEETALLCNDMNVCYPSGMYFDAVDLPSQGNFCGGSGNNWFGNYSQPQPSNYVYKIDENLPNTPINWYYLGLIDPLNPLYPGPYKGNVVNPLLASNLCYPEFPCGFVNGNNQERFYSGDSTFRASYVEKIIQDSISYNNYPDENKYYDKEYAVNTLLDDSNFVINNIHDQFLQAVDQENIIKLKEISTLLKSGEVNLAYIKNNSFLYRNVIEQNIGTVNSILLSKLINNDLSPFNTTQINTLSNIAYQPAMLGGKGVYNARSLLRLRIEDGASSLRQSALTNFTQTPSIEINLYPNPAKDEFTVSSSELINNIEIFDLSGKIIERLNIAFNQKSISITNYKNGFYFVDVHLQDGKKKQFKLGIIH